MIDWNRSTYAAGLNVVEDVLPDIDRRLQIIERALGFETRNFRGELILDDEED